MPSTVAATVTKILYAILDSFDIIVVALTLLSFIKLKADISLGSSININNSPVIRGESLMAYIGLRATPPPPPPSSTAPPLNISSLSDPSVPKLLFDFRPFITRTAITSDGLQYDIVAIFIRNNKIVEKALLRKNTGVYMPNESFDLLLEVYNVEGLYEAITIGDDARVIIHF
ncbi:MAG: hypothetical protein QXF17_04340 [Ignisphaera sp.]